MSKCNQLQGITEELKDWKLNEEEEEDDHKELEYQADRLAF